MNDFLENRVSELESKNFDFIIFSSLLHELKNPKEFLAYISKICNSNTIIHINVPNSRSFHLVWAYESGLIQQLDTLTPTAQSLQQNSTFNLDKLKEFTLEYFDILESGSYFIKPFNHTKMSKCLEESIIDEALLDGLYSIAKYMPDLGAEIFVNCKKK